MGSAPSMTREEMNEYVDAMYLGAVRRGLIPDITIDTSLTKYSELNSASVLHDSYQDLQSELWDSAPEYAAELGPAIASVAGAPSAVGLGALVISLILDVAIKSYASGKTDSTLNMVRRVFAEEKASGVRDSIEECLKRLAMYTRDPSKALEELNRLEKQLSNQLTTLKNSMLHDKQMTPNSMKFWTNGAAFHSQMLIHAARLKMAEDAWRNVDDLAYPVSRVVDLYQRDLHGLLKLYFSEVDDDMFEKWTQVKELKSYFSRLRGNIKELIEQSQPFNLE